MDSLTTTGASYISVVSMSVFLIRGTSFGRIKNGKVNDKNYLLHRVLAVYAWLSKHSRNIKGNYANKGKRVAFVSFILILICDNLSKTVILSNLN